MIYAFWGTLAGVLVLFLAAAHQAIPTFGAREPAGAHHKPRKPPLRQRLRERRQAEETRNEETVRVYQQIRDDLAGATAYSEGTPTLLEPELEHYDDPQVMAYARMGEAAEPGWEDAVEDYAAAMHTGNVEAIADARNGGHPAYANHLYRPLPPEVRVPVLDCDTTDHVPGCGALPALERCVYCGLEDYEPGFGCHACGTAELEDPLDVATPGQVADELVGPLSTPVDTPAPEPDPVVLTDYGPATGSWEAVRDEVLDAIPLVDAVVPKDGAR